MKTNLTPARVLFYSLTILSAPILGVYAQDASRSKDAAIEGVSAAQLERVRRQEALQHAQMIIADANAASAQGDYLKALNLYRDAEKLVIPNAPASSVEMDQIQSGKAAALFQLANAAYNNGDYAQ